jgi:hypothetical protein
LQLVVDYALTWMHRESMPTQGKEERIPLLRKDNRGQWTILDVHITNPNSPIVDGKTCIAVEKALADCKFHIEYKKGSAWKTRRVSHLQSKKFKEDEIAERVRKEERVVRQNKQIWRPKERGEVAVVFKPSTHTFSVSHGDETTMTVARYFQIFHDITLQYPEMPLVRISSMEYFPLEFLFQGMQFEF